MQGERWKYSILDRIARKIEHLETRRIGEPLFSEIKCLLKEGTTTISDHKTDYVKDQWLEYNSDMVLKIVKAENITNIIVWYNDQKEDVKKLMLINGHLDVKVETVHKAESKTLSRVLVLHWPKKVKTGKNIASDKHYLVTALTRAFDYMHFVTIRAVSFKDQWNFMNLINLTGGAPKQKRYTLANLIQMGDEKILAEMKGK